jgi:Adenylate and Guanylate cyclase catalytic domain
MCIPQLYVYWGVAEFLCFVKLNQSLPPPFQSILSLCRWQQKYYEDRTSNTPIIVTTAIILTMTFSVFMFLVYDRLVERRQAIVLKSANQSSAIVSSLFPKSITDRLLDIRIPEIRTTTDRSMTAKTRLKSFLCDSKDNQGLQPIADLFLETTVLFADIAGFTAWSSSRDPTHVFTLLQTLYQGFDRIAHKEKVFKVETIGDAYVAVTGLPDPQKNHALIMAKFACSCVQRLQEMLLDLELKLGPDTADLGKHTLTDRQWNSL